MNTPRSQLRHREIGGDALPPQRGVPPRTRAQTAMWEADDQNGRTATVTERTGRTRIEDRPLRSDVGMRTSSGREEVDDRPVRVAAGDDIRTSRLWADVVEANEEEIPVREDRQPTTRAASRSSITTRPQPLQEEVAWDEEPIVTEALQETDLLADEQDLYDEELVYQERFYTPRRASARPAPQTKSMVLIKSPRRPQQRDVHLASWRQWLFPAGVGMIVLLLLYIAASLAFMWGQDRYNDCTYGVTRTFHIEAPVGDHDSAVHPSHFTAMNIHGHIEVIEFPGGDASHAKVFVGPQLYWPSVEKAVVTLQIKDMNHDGRPDVLVHISGEPALFTNTPAFDYVLQSTKDGLKQP